MKDLLSDTLAETDWPSATLLATLPQDCCNGRLTFVFSQADMHSAGESPGETKVFRTLKMSVPLLFS